MTTPDAARLTGLRNLLGREASAWWHTRTWWVHLLAYLIVVDGLGMLVLLEVARGAPTSAGGLPPDATLPFFVFHLLFVSAGVIVTAQDAIVGEVQRGTAAWILSKPVSRAHFVLAKMLGLGGGFLAVGVLAPLAAALPAWAALGLDLSAGDALVVFGGLALMVSFFLSATLMLGTLFSSRAAVAGSAFALLFVMTQFGPSLPHLLPGGIPFRLAELLQDGTLGVTPFLTTAASVGAFLLVAVRRFERIEL